MKFTGLTRLTVNDDALTGYGAGTEDALNIARDLARTAKANATPDRYGVWDAYIQAIDDIEIAVDTKRREIRERHEQTSHGWLDRWFGGAQ